MIGIDSEFCNVESFITGLTDKWPKYLHAKRKTFTLLVCAGMFVLSSSMVTNVSINQQRNCNLLYYNDLTTNYIILYC